MIDAGGKKKLQVNDIQAGRFGFLVLIMRFSAVLTPFILIELLPV